MTTINIDKRDVARTNRNGRINNSNNISSSSSSSTAGSTNLYSFENGVDASGNVVTFSGTYTGNTTIIGNLDVSGRITASQDVIAYMAGAVGGTVLDALSATFPLQKTGTNLALNLNASQFNVVNNALNYIGSTGLSSVAWNDVTSKPTFATVATSGSYNDLNNKPSITSTIAGSTDVTSYFNGTKALTAAVADSANDIWWGNINGRPTTFTPTAHTLASHSDISTYFNGYKALTAGTADSANAVTWTNVSSKPTTFTPEAHNQGWSTITDKPTTFTPSSHTISSHSDSGSYFSGYKAIDSINSERAEKANTAGFANTAGESKTSKELNGIAGDKFYNSDNFNKSTVTVTCSTLYPTTIEFGGWKISSNYGYLYFHNSSNVLQFQLGQEGTAFFTGDVIAFAII